MNEYKHAETFQHLQAVKTITSIINRQGSIFHVLPQKGHKQNYILKVSMTMHFKLSHVLWKVFVHRMEEGWSKRSGVECNL